MARGFDGANSKIAGPTITNLLSDRTVAAWIKPTTVGEGGFGRIVRVEIGTGTAFEFSMATSLALRMSSNWDTVNSDAQTTNTLTASSWACVASAYRNSDKKWRIFLGNPTTAMAEGSYGSQNAGSVSEITGGTNVMIGNRSDQTGTFDGTISRAAIWNRELSLYELELFRNGIIPLNGLVTFLPLTSPTNTQVEDIITMTSGTATSTSVTEDPPLKLMYGQAVLLGETNLPRGRDRVRASGVFVQKPELVRVSGTFVQKQVQYRQGGSFASVA